MCRHLNLPLLILLNIFKVAAQCGCGGKNQLSKHYRALWSVQFSRFYRVTFCKAGLIMNVFMVYVKHFLTFFLDITFFSFFITKSINNCFVRISPSLQVPKLQLCCWLPIYSKPYHFSKNLSTINMLERSVSANIVSFLGFLRILHSAKSKFLDTIGLIVWMLLLAGLAAVAHVLWHFIFIRTLVFPQIYPGSF